MSHRPPVLAEELSINAPTPQPALAYPLEYLPAGSGGVEMRALGDVGLRQLGGPYAQAEVGHDDLNERGCRQGFGAKYKMPKWAPPRVSAVVPV